MNLSVGKFDPVPLSMALLSSCYPAKGGLFWLQQYALFGESFNALLDRPDIDIKQYTSLAELAQAAPKVARPGDKESTTPVGVTHLASRIFQPWISGPASMSGGRMLFETDTHHNVGVYYYEGEYIACMRLQGDLLLVERPQKHRAADPNPVVDNSHFTQSAVALGNQLPVLLGSMHSCMTAYDAVRTRKSKCTEFGEAIWSLTSVPGIDDLRVHLDMRKNTAGVIVEADVAAMSFGGGAPDYKNVFDVGCDYDTYIYHACPDGTYVYLGGCMNRALE